MVFSFLIMGAIKPRSDRHRVGGVINVDGAPAEQLVVVLNRDTFGILAATLSNKTDGTWRVFGVPELPERQLLVLALDKSGNYNAEVADYISQVATI